MKQQTHYKLSPKLSAVIIALTSALAFGLILFFCYVRVLIRRRWPFLDAEWKGAKDRLELWEILLSACVIPALAWRLRIQFASALLWAVSHQRTSFFALIAALSVVYTTIQFVVFRPEKCKGWIHTDVGWMHGEGAAHSHMLHTLCIGRIWEEHVGRAVSELLYGQGRAIDVGAFTGYHTLRLAKHAAPFNVYAFEGRSLSHLLENLRRNNAQNVKVFNQQIDSSWRLDPVLEKELLDDEKPLAFIKIDCETCELDFLRGARRVIEKWHPAIVLEIQDDKTRSQAVVGGQQMIKPRNSRNDVLHYLRTSLNYSYVEPLRGDDDLPTWDYLALRLRERR